MMKEKVERLEDLLKYIWEHQFEGRDLNLSLEELERLEKEGYIRVDRDDAHKDSSDKHRSQRLRKCKLTEKGLKTAQNLVRLHRLAERMLSDLLETSDDEVERSACRFEHIISEEVEEAICTLLGHPTTCPHGRRIPKGKCCKRDMKEVKRVIYRLSELKPGDMGEVKYIVGGDEIIRKAIALGIFPGNTVRVIRIFPTFVVQIANSQIALDEDVASRIYLIRYEV